MPAEPKPLGLLLLAGSHERAHFAFVLAAGAAALGRQVVLFATNRGCHALLADWSGLAGSERDAVLQARGVAGLGELRDACHDLAVRMIVCEAGLAAEALTGHPLAPGVEVAGVASFLAETAQGQVISL